MHDQPAIRAALYTVPFGQDFCHATVSAIFDRCGGDPLALNDVLLLLPNNRAIKAMTEAFVREASPGLLLPKMAAIGDLALDETLGPIIDPLENEGSANFLPAIETLQRQFILAKKKVNGSARPRLCAWPDN
jgi:ATP-dependent helicase/nuclease subunit B